MADLVAQTAAPAPVLTQHVEAMSGPVPQARNEEQDTFYLVPRDKDEVEASMHWRDRNPHVFDDNICIELPLALLTRRSKVFVLCRKAERGKNGGKLQQSNPIIDTVDGAHIHGHVEPEKLADDFKLYGPVVCSGHWETGERHFMNRLNREGFLRELQTVAAPYTFGWTDGNECKHPKLPSVLYLRSA